MKCSCSMFADCSPVSRDACPNCVDVYTSLSLVNEIFFGLAGHSLHTHRQLWKRALVLLGG